MTLTRSISTATPGHRTIFENRALIGSFWHRTCRNILSQTLKSRPIPLVSFTLLSVFIHTVGEYHSNMT